VILDSEGTKADFLRANVRLKIRDLKKCHPVAATLQLMRQRQEGIHMTANRWADDAEVSQWPEDRTGG
jgi:hypothetical protein